MTEKIGLFYGSSTCYTEIAAEKIRDYLGAQRVDIYDIADSGVAAMADYRLLILGIPTWDYGELQEDWESLWDDIDALDFHGKTVALYGLGDQIGYPEWFQDALGYLWAKVAGLGASCVGRWPVTGYSFEQSRAVTADGAWFVGLALDDENDFEQTDTRIALWCQQILREFGLAP
ncbi:MAG: flavodoxin FldB [Porticoccaceae bacterium]